MDSPPEVERSRQLRRVIDTLDRVELKQALKGFHSSYGPEWTNEELADQLYTHVILLMGKSNLQGAEKKANALSSGLRWATTAGLAYLFCHIFVVTGEDLLHILRVGVTDLRAGLKGGLGDLREGVKAGLGDLREGIKVGIEGLKSGVEETATRAKATETATWAGTTAASAVAFLSASNIFGLWAAIPAAASTAASAAYGASVTIPTLAKNIASMYDKLSGGVPSTHGAENDEFPSFRDSDPADDATKETPGISREQEQEIVNKMSQFRTVVIILCGAWGVSFVMNGIGKALSVDDASSRKILDSILNGKTRSPDQFKYNALRQKCKGASWTGCLLKRDCKYNSRKKTCSVRDDLKYLYKVAKTTKEIRQKAKARRLAESEDEAQGERNSETAQ